ncbi:c-type cytochrome [Paenibacillus xerothermodurans]|uniref:Cytochrome c n=1 Tax=Paenibacillus xerothermodurans TaxID=1977292 RepID=A0A2W1NSK4_PAEXE|nr:cytochrome c [Paenibacillus xerothermodurans]PZE20736.1 cytochrome c [Paenibacillus xerothermodurans]
MLRKIILSAIAVLLAVTISACGQENAPVPDSARGGSPPADENAGGGTTDGDADHGNTGGDAADGAAQQQVQALYRQNCATCHGAELRGRVNLERVGARLSAEQIASMIANGGRGMPAFGGRLTAEEINALAWLAAHKQLGIGARSASRPQ